MSARTLFSRLAEKTASYSGRGVAFVIALSVILAWALTGPIFGYSDTWQLVINTGTTVITFLMVFLIQNTQNRDARAMQLKLDELIRATQGAHIGLLDLEEMDEADLNLVRDKYLFLAREAHKRLTAGGNDTGTPEL